MKRSFLSLTLALQSILCFAPATSAADERPLTSADRKLLDGLLKEFLFDPEGAERVSLRIKLRDAWGSTKDVPTEGWLVASADGKPARVYFIDGASILAPAANQFKKIDFVAVATARFAAPKAVELDEAKREEKERSDGFRKMREKAIGVIADDELAQAAWLHRLGHDDLAARALAETHKREGDPRQNLRKELAWSAFANMVHAYMVRADEEAEAHGERLKRLYGEELKDKEYWQASLIVDELKRRKEKGTFGKSPSVLWPDGFSKWETKQKVAWLIEQLDEVDVRQFGQPGGVPLALDRRVQELIRIGDPAVPDLIDALANDNRLTRSVHLWRDFSHDRTVLSVREAALSALMSILQIHVFEAASTGDNFTARGPGEARKMAAPLRDYWKEYGGLVQDERIMKRLTSNKSSFEAKREAASNIAHLGDQRTLATTVFSDFLGTRRKGANPAVAKFTDPTAAEAILSAMDVDLKDHDAKPRDNMHDYERRHIEDAYLLPLQELGDKRIAHELADRSRKAPSVRMQCKMAHAAALLGEPDALMSFAKNFAAGKIPIPANDEPNTNENDQPGNVELRGIVGALADVDVPEVSQALYALADPKHPSYAVAADRVLKDFAFHDDESVWFRHPFCLQILRRQLDDTQPTGTTIKIEGEQLTDRSDHGSSSGSIPEWLADPQLRRDEAIERKCDAAAAKMSELVMGLPRYHPLFKDAEKRLEQFKAAFDHFGKNYRAIAAREHDLFGVFRSEPAFIPAIAPLGRAATGDDVKAGRAIFQLNGKGKAASLKLPASASLRSSAPKETPEQVLVVQAEEGDDGAVTCGVILRNDVRAVSRKDLNGIKALPRAEVRPVPTAED